MRKRRLTALDAQVKKHCYRKGEAINRTVYLCIIFPNLFYCFYMIFFFKGEASKRPRRDGDDENDESNDSGTVI